MQVHHTTQSFHSHKLLQTFLPKSVCCDRSEDQSGPPAQKASPSRMIPQPQVYTNQRPTTLSTLPHEQRVSMATTVRSPPEGSESDDEIGGSLEVRSDSAMTVASSPNGKPSRQDGKNMDAKGMSFGNTIFAVSGIPSYQSGSGNKKMEASSSAGDQRKAAGIPVIMTQPSRGSGLVGGAKGAQDLGVMSRSFDGDLPGIHGRPSSAGAMRRAMSPQPAHLAAASDPRRAISPGPEFYSSREDSSRQQFDSLGRRAISPGPEMLRNIGANLSFASRAHNASQRSSLGLTGGMAPPGTSMPQNRGRGNKAGTPPSQVAMATTGNTPSQQGKRADYIRSPQVQLVNPTKLQAFEGQNKPRS